MDSDFLKRAISAGDYDADVLRQIDTLVAEKVMGWKKDKVHIINTGELVDAWVHIQKSTERIEVYTWDKPPHVFCYEWKPTEDIAQAWQVVARMRELGWIAEIVAGGRFCHVRFESGECDRIKAEVETEGQDALAICLVAPGAVGVKI